MADLLNPTISTTDKLMYIVEVSTGQRIEIQFVPEKLTINSTANQAKVEVVGRNNPLYHYVNGEDKMNFQLDFYADDEEKLEVKQRVEWLQALRYNDAGTKRKKNVIVVWGDLFDGGQWIWTVESIKVEYSGFRPDKNMLPQQAYVDIALALDPGRNIRQSDFRK